jgi:vitamin B12 transporter
MTTALLVFLGALSRLIPHPPNAAPIGALALFAGARLTGGRAIAVPLVAMALSDFFLDFGTALAFFSVSRLTIYTTFAAIVLLGRAFARARWPGIAAGTLAASILFFVTSNLAVWTEGHLYPRNPAGFLLCFVTAIPFFGNTVAADAIGSLVLFGSDTLARRRAQRLRRAVAALLFIAVLAAGAPAHGQTVPVSDSVVVTATLFPEEERTLGSATTVITRREIESKGATTVLELLRNVPGLDVARQGSDGSLTSVFLRGTNSTQTLVLVDGARVNSPYFSGYDFSALTTENVERIEIVRGPFSALYGSDAIGGVVQIFTRAASPGFAGQAAAEAGSAGQRQGSVFFSAGGGPFAAAGSYRYARVGGDRPNSDWKEQNGSARLEGRFFDIARAALEVSILDGDVGVPGPVGLETPRARGGFREERIELPVWVQPAAGHETTLVLARVASKPTFRNPDDPFGFTSSDTDARTWQGRISDTWRTGAHEVTAVASWERWIVDAKSSFGTALDGARSTILGFAGQDTFRLGTSWFATAGLRYDHHSRFGRAWSPRATLAWLSSDGLWKLRASAGSAFRAPSVGELSYPFSGNPDLQPERSVSYELGAERYVGPGRLEASFFSNELRDLIVYDFVAQKNENIGRARTRGAEIAWHEPLDQRLGLDVGYTYLDTVDRGTGQELLRRPRHRAFAAATWRPTSALTVSPRATFIGRRADVDAVTFERIENASFLRYDLFLRYALWRLTPYARIENLTDRRYDEVAGYPAPSRRFAVGLEAKF